MYPNWGPTYPTNHNFTPDIVLNTISDIPFCVYKLRTVSDCYFGSVCWVYVERGFSCHRPHVSECHLHPMQATAHGTHVRYGEIWIENVLDVHLCCQLMWLEMLKYVFEDVYSWYQYEIDKIDHWESLCCVASKQAVHVSQYLLKKPTICNLHTSVHVYTTSKVITHYCFPQDAFECPWHVFQSCCLCRYLIRTICVLCSYLFHLVSVLRVPELAALVRLFDIQPVAHG